MTKANELRLENWVWLVYSPYGNEQSREYRRIDINEMKRAAGILSVNSFYHEPIPLTTEILEKAGFVEQRKGNHVHVFELGSNPELEYQFALSSHFISGFLLKGHRVGKIQYLHQLQNMYFALTGEELEISL